MSEQGQHGGPKDPRSSARAKAELPKRFYVDVTIEPEGSGFALKLDGRSARTPARNPLIVPTRALAESLAAEWRAQRDTINPATMPITRLANSALDGVTGRMDEVRAAVRNYAESDLLIYRAGEPKGLVQRQAEFWDPIVRIVEKRLGVRFVLSDGVMHVAQPPNALAAVTAEVARFDEPFRLSGLNLATTLTGSVLIALVLSWGEIDASAAWTAAHVDEDWNISQWGEDADATTRRALHETDFRAAALALLHD